MKRHTRSEAGRSHERTSDGDDSPPFYVIGHVDLYGYPVIERFHGDPVAFFIDERDAHEYARWRCLTRNRGGPRG